jgi:DNA repair protein RadC
MTYEIISKRTRKPVTIKHPSDIYDIAKRYAYNEQEYFLVLTLDGSHSVISSSIVTIGLVNRTIVHPREVFKHAISDNASAIIVCHNHPSGCLDPSDEDLKITKKLEGAGNIIGIRLLDHVIISKTDYYSFRQNNLLSF